MIYHLHLVIIQICWRLQLLQMGKKIIKEALNSRRTSTRVIKKKKHPEEEQFYHEQSSDSQISPHDDVDSDQPDSQQNNSSSGYSESDSNDGEDDSGDSQSISEVKPENMAIRNMQFRQRRGTKMNYLINRKKEEEEDPFWAQQGNQFFGDLEDGDNDEEDYVQSSSGRDQFDSDFDQTESQHNGQEDQQIFQEKQVDDQQQKQKKKRDELMRKIKAPAPPIKKGTVKSIASSTVKRNESQEAASKYIHMAFNQQQLLGEAATTQYYNWLSLKKLISIQTQKKDFTKRSHHVEGPKIIYRDRINQEGVRELSYQLQNTQIKKVEDLSYFMSQN